MLVRALTLAALLLAAAPAAAQNSNPPAYLPADGPGARFPLSSDRWYYAFSQPAGRGQQRFTRVDAVPTGRSGSWTVTVTCGLVSTRTGKETGVIVGTGTAGRGRMPIIGLNFLFRDGSPRTGGAIDQSPSDGDRLDLTSTFSDPRCASGRGDLSTGD